MIQRSQNGFLQVLGIVHWKKNVKISRQSNIVTKSGTRTSFKETNVQIDLLISSIYASSLHSYISQSGLKTYQYYAEFLGAEQNNCVFLQASNSCYVIQQWDSLWINLFPVMTLNTKLHFQWSFKHMTFTFSVQNKADSSICYKGESKKCRKSQLVLFLHTPASVWVLIYQWISHVLQGELIVTASLWLTWIQDGIKVWMIKTIHLICWDIQATLAKEI